MVILLLFTLCSQWIFLVDLFLKVDDNILESSAIGKDKDHLIFSSLMKPSFSTNSRKGCSSM